MKVSYQICVSGAAKGKSVNQGRELAYQAGAAIAKAGHVLMTGATTGLPDHAAHGVKAAGGMSIGLSPAASKVSHVKKYRLPTRCYDTILYTGLNYVGRDSLLIASSDAVVSIGGRLGTLHEFTIAMEMDKPIGFLEGAGGVGTEIKDILKAAGKENADNVFFDSDATKLIAKMEQYLAHEYGKDNKIFRQLSETCEYCDKLKP